MKNLEVRTRNQTSNAIDFRNNLSNAIVFLRHDEDKIIVKNGEQVEVEIYDNGELIFIGDKQELFEKLKTKP